MCAGGFLPIYDISLPISPSLPVWPGDPAVEVTHLLTMDHGDPINLPGLQFSAHTGTHIDAPRHVLRGGAPVDTLPLDILIGPALVVELTTSTAISAADLDRLDIPVGTKRLLFKTRNSRVWQGPITPVFQPDFIALDVSAAAWVVERNVRLVGVDYISVEGYETDPDLPVHTTLLKAGVVIIEGLALAGVPPGPYQLIALPIKLADADGAPTRAVLMT
jgi:arylformamidase